MLHETSISCVTRDIDPTSKCITGSDLNGQSQILIGHDGTMNASADKLRLKGYEITASGFPMTADDVIEYLTLNHCVQQEHIENFRTAHGPTNFKSKMACLDDCDISRGRQVPPYERSCLFHRYRERVAVRWLLSSGSIGSGISNQEFKRRHRPSRYPVSGISQ